MGRLSVQDLGMGRDARQQPVRLMQTRWLDDETITPPGNGPAVRQARVRDEIVPVAVSTY